MRKRPLLIIAACFCLACNPRHQASNQSVPLEKCRIRPSFPALMQMPAQGFVSVDENGAACPPDTSNICHREHSGTFDLIICTDGPHGSGRYWTIVVSIVAPAADLSRGLCINTTTAGRRTLNDFEGRPLPWTEDLDGDGQSELILWESIAVTNDPDLSGILSGLVAWVYRANKEGVLRLDWALSRNFAKRIAAAYRKPDNNTPFEHHRKQMAKDLEAFAQGKCQAPE